MGCLDFITDSVLRLHRQAGLTEDETRFYTACIVLGLEAMHQRGILHRSVGRKRGKAWEDRGSGLYLAGGSAHLASLFLRHAMVFDFSPPPLMDTVPQGP